MEDKLRQAYDYQKDGLYDRALECFNGIAAEKEYRERATLEIGKTYKMMNRPSKAIDAFVAVLQWNAAQREAIRELGETARLSSLFEKATVALENIAGRTGNLQSFLELGKIYFCTGDFDKARTYFGRYQQRSLQDADTTVWLAKIYKREGEFEKARAELDRALEIVSGHRDALFEIGDLCQQQSDFKNAIEFFEKAVSVSRDDKASYFRLVELYALSDDEEKSARAAAEVLRLTPPDAFSQDSALNEIEILQRKTILVSRVKRLWVTVTSRCNIRCKTCGLWHNQWDLPYKTAQEVMALYPYLERVVWLGGEVFLYKHFEEMFDEAARHHNMKQQVITNGFILNKKWIEKIVSSGNAELTFSVDGVTKEVYESIRQGSNFERLLENLELTMETKRRMNSKIDLRMNALIMRTNHHQIKDFIDFARDKGFNQVSLMALHFDMAPEENIFYDAKDPAVLRFISTVLPELRNKAREYGIDLDILLPPGDVNFEQVVDEKNKEKPQAAPEPERKVPAAAEGPRPLYCRMPWQYMMICDKGDVYLTGSCVKTIGNIYGNSLDGIWNSAVSQHYRRSMGEHKFGDLCRTECISRWQ